jgi:phosphatidylinositol alpha-1,6-mannosyltransferase
VPDARPIVIATTDFRPMVGGVADYLHRMAESVAARHDVTVATSVSPGKLHWTHSYRLDALPPLPERRLGRRIGDGIAAIRKLHTGAYFLSLKQYGRRVVDRARRNERDAPVLIIGIWDTASHFWCAACRDRGVPYYLVAYGVEIVLPLYGVLPEWRRVDFAAARGVIAVSHATADLATSRLGLAAKPFVVNPIAGEPLTGPAVDARARELQDRLGGAAGPVLLSVGRLVARKGFDEVLKSVAALTLAFPQLRYVLVGDGAERQRLQDRAASLGIADRVLMLGRADDAMKWAAYERCDLFVMPNRALAGTDWEGFGIVFVEAARAGRAVVAGNSGGVADAVAHGETGLLVDVDDPAALTTALEMLLRDDTLRRRMGDAARCRARQAFSCEALQRRVAAALELS